MKQSIIALVTLLALLTACQSIPAVRKNNCTCNWEPLGYETTGGFA